jgi:hypothetical protein
MSLITPEGTLIIENSHLDVRGNVNAVALKLGTARLTPSYDLAAVTGVGNSTPYTVEFSNATTGLATTSNLQVGGTLKLGGTVDFENPLSLAAVSLVSNTTPYTIEFSNAATGIATTANVDVGGELAVTGNATVSSNLTVSGDATVSSNLTVSGNATVSSNLTVSGNATVSSNLTVSGNATVTGDLNVSGALGILDAIYPVGTIIDRATAITDTHLNGKYKAFLAAPNQEWELVPSSTNTIVLENLLQSGQTTSFCGRATLTPALGEQALTTTFVVITGSEITNFTPVLGTKKVRYHFQFHHAHSDDAGLGMYQLEFKVDFNNWVEINDANISVYGVKVNDIIDLSWVITLDDVDDSSAGSTTAVRPVLGIRVVGREYSSAHQARVHQSKYYAGTPDFRPPLLNVQCIGPSQVLKYERTV